MCVNFLLGGGCAAEWVNDKSDCLFSFFFFLFSSQAPQLNAMGYEWGKDGWGQRLRSTKPFQLLKIFLASLIALVAEELSTAMREDLTSDVTLMESAFSLKMSTSVIWKSYKEQEGSMPVKGAARVFSARALTGRMPMLWKAGKNKGSMCKQRNKKAGAPALLKQRTFPPFLFHGIFGSCC